jgi:hypothetical protein
VAMVDAMAAFCRVSAFAEVFADSGPFPGRNSGIY